MGFSLLSGCRVFYFCAVFVAWVDAQECVKATSWLFSLPEDLNQIYQGLRGPFVIVEDGEVTSVLSNPDFAAFIGLSNEVSEFPLVWCNTGSERINYTLTLESSNPNNLAHPLVSVHNTGVLPTTPYRFRACFPCLSESHTITTVNVTLRMIRPSGEEYCPASFYFSKNCNMDSQRRDPFEIFRHILLSSLYNQGMKCAVVKMALFQLKMDTSLGIADKREENITMSPQPHPQRKSIRLETTLVAILVPVAFLCLVMGVFISWLGWYRKRNKKIASFQPEAVGLVYQGIYSTWSQKEPHEKEFAFERLTLARELGEGAFGVVYEAIAEGVEEEGETSIVAVKQLRGDSDLQLVEDFFREVDFMSRLKHPRIVCLLGVCSQHEPFAMVFEYMDLGDLRNFLRDAAGLGMSDDEERAGVMSDNPLLTKSELLSIAVQVAEGMVYVSSKNLIHRDLASRNCLVATGLVIKIADFGMSRDLDSTDYYRVHGSAMLPVRWMPPESILYGKFSTQTDVWAFGVLLWEIFTFGQQPYTGLTNEEVIKCVERGVHPEIPPGCPVTHLMNNCWKRAPKSRPSFEAICANLKILLSTSQ